uniref:Uncharacterized protein n=1 Tax=Arion vulgaris TaxID=1028688 RepID=A0A0B6ZWI1_9EUPU
MLEPPTHTQNLFEQNRKFCLSRCEATIKEMKKEVQREMAGKCSLVVGVSCGINSAIGEQLAELIWQRSLFADCQIFMFDDQAL